MPTLSETAANVIENLACRLAQANKGRISPHHVLPYLPISLGLVQECLDEMCDESSVTADVRDNLCEYEFTAYRDGKSIKAQEEDDCIGCGQELRGRHRNALCADCSSLLDRELNHLAETTGWPAQAVYEHAIMYQASKHRGPVPAETLAASTRYTLRSMRRKLDKLTLEKYARQELDERRGLMTYVFPKIDYPKQRFRENMAVIRSHPASVMEEVQLKVVRILIALGLMFLAMLVLAFWGFPFPALVLMLLVFGPVTALAIWFRREKAQED